MDQHSRHQPQQGESIHLFNISMGYSNHLLSPTVVEDLLLLKEFLAWFSSLLGRNHIYHNFNHSHSTMAKSFLGISKIELLLIEQPIN